MSKTDTHDTPDHISEQGWEELAKNLLRAEMMRRGVSYAVLADKLEAIGIQDNELNLRNKVGRGRFTAVFMLQCFRALGVEWIHFPPSIEEGASKGGAQSLAKTKGPDA